MALYRKSVFSALLIRFFWQKKIENVEKIKVRKYDEESVFSRKQNVFIFLKAFSKNGKVQKKPVVAGHLVQKNLRRKITAVVFSISPLC